MITARHLKEVARSHPVEVLKIQEPEDGFHGLPQDEFSVAPKLKENGFFTYVGWCDGEHENCDLKLTRCDTKIWRISERGKAIQDQLNRPHTLPCNHQGLHCITSGETYTCQNSDCGERFSKETAKKTFFQ